MTKYLGGQRATEREQSGCFTFAILNPGPPLILVSPWVELKPAPDQGYHFSTQWAKMQLSNEYPGLSPPHVNDVEAD